jgi:peptidoglycan hydrolase-like protein with peptidoglycan-binding domain
MSKKYFTIAIIIIIFLGVVGFFWVLNRNTNPEPSTDISSGDGEFFPFGSISIDKEREEQINNAEESSSIIDLSNLPIFGGGDEEDPDFIVIDSRFEQIYDKAVAGYTSFTREYEEVVNDPKETIEGLVETYNFLDIENLSLGSDNDEVEKLKITLNKQNLDTVLEVSTIFDISTKTALIEFQNKNDLDADGVVGPKTREKLNEVQNISTNPEDYIPETVIKIENIIRFQEKSNGHVFEHEIDTSSQRKLSNTTLRGLHESLFGENGEVIVSRYLSGESIRTFVSKIQDSEGSSIPRDSNELGDLGGEFMVDNITSVDILPDSNKLVYLVENITDSIAYIHDIETGISKKLFTSKLKEWLVDIVNEDSITVTSKASFYSSGFSYSYRNTTGYNNTPAKLIDSVVGLTTTSSPDGEFTLYSETTTNGGIATSLLNNSTGVVRTLGISTLAEKCVFGSNSTLYCAVPKFASNPEFPDAWYKGEVLFNDTLWVVNLDNSQESIILDPSKQKRRNFDIVGLQINNGILLFQNKYDQTLWKYEIEQE